MGYSAPPSLPCCQPSTDEPRRILVELREAKIALTIAEHHIKLWYTNSTTSGTPLIADRRSYAAHEALYEASNATDRIAEMLRIETKHTPTTKRLSHSVQIDTEALSTEPPL